ncbi:MAG: hypothetical protein M1436_03085 [Acidobacteria bacterium]|nr:hypothetical protein [Acidobacteriota bacterium]
MKFKRFLVMASALILALAISPAVMQAQGPLYDRVLVNLPYTVTVGDHTLQPGDYVISQFHSSGPANRELLIYSDNGTKFETSALTIPVLDNNTARDTKVILHHFGPDYYFDRIWIVGKNYGYEFPLPASVKARERERMAPLTIAATYQAAPEQAAAPPPEQTEIAQAPPPPPPEEAPAPAPPPPQQAPAPAPAPAPAEAPPPPPAMPATSANWLLMMLGGGSLSGLGLALRRRK